MFGGTFKLMGALIVALLIAATAMRIQRNEARAELANYRAAVATATALAEKRARAIEADLNTQTEQTATALRKDLAHEQSRKDRLLAGVRAGTERLSIAASCPAAGQAATDPSAAPGSGPESARAELDRSTAEALITIAIDGDTAIRERNACIALYESTRATLNKD